MLCVTIGVLKLRLLSLAAVTLIAVLFSANACAGPAPASVTNYGPGSGETTTPPSTGSSDLGLPPAAFDESKWVVTEAEAIAIANEHVPAAVAAHARITTGKEIYGNTNTGEIHYDWQVIYGAILVTRQ